MGSLTIIGIILFLLTFLTVAARGGSSVEGKTPPTQAQVPPTPTGAPPKDHLVTTEHSAVIRGASIVTRTGR